MCQGPAYAPPRPREHLITGVISSTDLPFKFRQRDVLDLHLTALLIGENIFCFGLIERASTILGARRGVWIRAFFGMWFRSSNRTCSRGTG